MSTDDLRQAEQILWRTLKRGAPTAPQKSVCWFRLVGDTFTVWFHGPEADLPRHMSSVHRNIEFTLETESESHLPFLDINIEREPDVSKGPIANLPTLCRT
jgi:hypothetical protein